MFPMRSARKSKARTPSFPVCASAGQRSSAAPRTTVLPELTLIAGDPCLIDRFSEIRDSDFESAHEQRQHLGECVVVTHASSLAERGRTVYVGMDDRDGQRTAARYGLRYFTVEDVMHYTVHADCFPDLAALKSAWDRLRRFGDGLCPFPQTELPGAWQDYRS